MGQLREKDREFLLRAFQLAETARKPIASLGMKPEPVWAALVATQDRELASAVFVPGDKQDPVKTLWEKFRAVEQSQEEVTLYLTLEPRASFERLPPVTESVRRLGVRRVVIGAEDPAQRFRGEGRRTLERMNIEVILADGEVARKCQLLLEDYASVIQKGLAVLRVRGELKKMETQEFDLSLNSPKSSDHPDAILYDSESEPNKKNDEWTVILDPKGTVKKSETKSILFQDSDKAGTPNSKKIFYRDGRPDLGALLRELAGMGILSVELSNNPQLFKEALRAGLVDSLVVHLPESYDTVQSLARIAKVHFRDAGGDLQLKLSGLRLMDGDSRSLVARVELC